MPKKYIWSLFLIGITYNSFSQKVVGTIKNNFGEPLSRANLILKKSVEDGNISEFFITNDKGNFSYILKKKYDTTIFIEVSVLNYEKIVDSIVNPEVNKTYHFDIVLTPKITELDEVIISERKKFTIKKDTVVFNPEAYKDGTERKVEDLIKKLPGIEVEENGRIKYRGKTVKAVKLDGDDLFGHNYSLGTKNISVNMIDQIEAIDKYSKNPLLKGIENSDNVALNLKLKKGKVDYSNTSTIGLGYGDKSYYNIGTNILGIAKSLKSFGTLSFNNTGSNNTPFDYFSKSISPEDVVNKELYAKTIINDMPLSSILNDSRTKVNNQWFGNYNFIYRLSKTFTLKSNLYYIQDEFFKQELYDNRYFTGKEMVRYIDHGDIIKTPENKRIDLKLTYNTTKKSLLELETSIQNEEIRSKNTLSKNLNIASSTVLKTSIFFWNNKLQFTNKLNTTSALQFVSVYSRNNIPQEFSTIGNFLTNENLFNSYDQYSEYRKEAFQNYLVFLGKKKRIKYALTGGINHYNLPFLSSLIENGNEVVKFRNNLKYIKRNYYTHISLAFQNKKWKLESAVAMNYIFQKKTNLQNEIATYKKNNFFPEPSLKISYRLNSVSKLKFIGSYVQKTPEEKFLIPNTVIIDNRSIHNTITSLELEKRQDYSLSYRLNDLFKNIDINVTSGYTNKKNVFLPQIDINTNFTKITYFQSPVNLVDYFTMFSIERYIGFAKTTLKHSSSYTISNFKNAINQSTLRDGESKNYNGTLFAKTAFRIPINFENTFNYTFAKYEVLGQASTTNYNLKNTFKTIIKLNKEWLITAIYDYFKPNIKSNQDFSFLDFSIRYRPQKIKWISGRFVGKNLLNNKTFEQIENSDYSTTVYQSNLIFRYFMLSLDINF